MISPNHGGYGEEDEKEYQEEMREEESCKKRAKRKFESDPFEWEAEEDD